MSTSNFAIGETITNAFEAYSVLDKIRDGKASTLYRVLCKSGRLRNRELALKLVRPCNSMTPPPSSSATPHVNLHQALHHPNIVSVLSAFSGSHGMIYVLELCSLGSLFDFLQSRPSPILLEPELRGVTKSLVDALTYLRRELVVHRNIDLSSVLLTGDFGVKLSGFDFATRLPTADSRISALCGSPNFAAPEMISGLSYGFSVDIWSVGCVMVACLNGSLPFEADTVPETCQKVLLGKFSLPKDLGKDVLELITGILQTKSEKRISLAAILSHPFIINLRPMTSLRLTRLEKTIDNRSNTLPPVLQEGSRQRMTPAFQTNQGVRHSHHYGALRLPQHQPRPILGDIGNVELRKLPCNRNLLKKAHPFAIGSRRVTSDPTPSNVKNLTEHEGIDINAPESLLDSPLTVVNNQEKRRPSSHVIDHTPSREAVTELSEITRVLQGVRVPDVPKHQKGFAKFEDPLGSGPGLEKPPIGTTRPTRFTTVSMKSQSHKTTYGQITILPSHSVLVDFRESQRRRGLIGNEILLIDSDGSKVSIYNAPHLSSPSYLVEPMHTFSLDALPSAYWKQYNDTARLIEQIKQRTPKLVVYSAAAKCTLMTNGPPGDIEVLFRSSMPTTNKMQVLEDRSPSMRLRFWRRNSSVEVARYVSGSNGEEWIKKIVESIAKPPYISAAEWKKLEQVERNAMDHLVRFVRLCEASERLIEEMQTDNKTPAKNHIKIGDHTLSSSEDSDQQKLAVEEKPSTNTIANSLTSLALNPRPPKLSVPASRSARLHEDGDEEITQGTPAHENEFSTKSTFAEPGPPWCDGDDDELASNGLDIKTRFIPSVGWCIRYGSRVSQGGRYRMMFLDGVALDVDVDEDWVEFTGQSGETAVHKIRDCGSRNEVGERMKVFEGFVSMFDEISEE